MMRFVGLIFIFILLASCKETGKDRTARLVNEWNGKIINYPDKMFLTSYGTDSVLKCEKGQSLYTILNYVDSTGCLSCRLQLPRWKEMIEQFDSIVPNKVSCLFAFYPKDKETLAKLLRKVHFDYFVYIDETDTLNRMNKFPNDEDFQTFLLDKENRIIAIGNPVHNPKIKELYLKIIMGDKAPQKEVKIQTTVACSNTTIDMGKFDWHQAQTATFALANTGDNPLVVTDVVTSCGCITADYGKEPVRSGNSVELKVHYKADHPEHFDKTIMVYCNAATSPIQLKIKGKAE